MQLVYLEVRSYSGCGWSAGHYYGKLKCKGHDAIELETRLSEDEAEQYTLQDSGYKYKRGDKTIRFPNYRRLEDFAIKFCGLFIPGAILVRGDHYTLEPMEIVNNPSGVDVKQLNALWRECERLGWWDGGNDEQVEQISDEWFSIIKEVTNEN